MIALWIYSKGKVSWRSNKQNIVILIVHDVKNQSAVVLTEGIHLVMQWQMTNKLQICLGYKTVVILPASLPLLWTLDGYQWGAI